MGVALAAATRRKSQWAGYQQSFGPLSQDMALSPIPPPCLPPASPGYSGLPVWCLYGLTRAVYNERGQLDKTVPGGGRMHGQSRFHSLLRLYRC